MCLERSGGVGARGQLGRRYDRLPGKAQLMDMDLLRDSGHGSGAPGREQ